MCGFATNCNKLGKSYFHDFSARPHTMSEGGSKLGDSLARNFTSKNLAKGILGENSTYLQPVAAVTNAAWPNRHANRCTAPVGAGAGAVVG